MYIRKIFTIAFILSIILPARTYSQPIAGTWAMHPSFYQQTEKMIDGENVTYFLLQQQIYDSKNATVNNNAATLFHYDKTSPEDGIRSLTSTYPLFPAIIRTATYSPANKWLAVGAQDGTIWIVPDNETPFSIYGLDNVTLPGKPTISSITENPSDGKLWIATTYGYAVANPFSREIEKLVFTDKAIDWLVPIGDTLVIFADGKSYCAPANEFPSSIETLDFLPIDISTAPSNLINGESLLNPMHIMPLTDKTFAFLGQRDDESSGKSIATATRDGNVWKLLPISQFDMRLLTEGRELVHRTANNCIPNRDGYFMQAQNVSYLLKRGIDPDFSIENPASEYANNIFVRRTHPEDLQRESSSWDFSNFWFFQPKEGFYQRSVANEEWRDLTDRIWPNAPAPYHSRNIVWNPKHGLLVSSHGIDTYFKQSYPSVPWLLSAYSDGNWNQLTPAFHIPTEISENETLQNFLKSRIESYPVANPDGLAIDPQNPDYAFAGSMFGGLVRINLADPSDMPVMVCSEKVTMASLPGALTICPFTAAWSNLCDFSSPSFDADGRLWSIFWDYDQGVADKYSITMYYFSPEQVRNLEKKAGENGDIKPGKLVVPTVLSPNYAQAMLALTHPDNKNILVLHGGNYGFPFYFVDHNGTPEDPSDDRIAVLERIYDYESGSQIKLGSPFTIWEDPYDGEVWISTTLGTFHVKPEDAFNDNTKAHRHYVKSSENSKRDKKILETAQTNVFAVDAVGNLWIGTDNQGVVCLSPDRSEVIGVLNATNSELPSNRIFGLCYNPERLSMMISTSKGIAEFFPESLGGSASTAKAIVFPTALTPSYRGWITISGIANGMELIVEDEDGNTIATLDKAVNGKAQWNGLNNSGDTPATGKYLIKNKANGATIATIPVLK